MSWEDETVGPDVAVAGRLISDRVTREAAAQVDLEQALEASRYATHPYTTHPKEWPPLVEVIDTRELPPVLVERYNAAGGEGTALCGIFPEIRRAWASVDNSLFLWRFDKWDGQCPEYSCENQAISAVGLVKSKTGIFIEAFQYLLVLATPVEIILLGVCCSASGDQSDPFAEISLQPLPEYTVSSDGVAMTCITSTDKGQIFMAGRDGHTYELQYTSGSSWQKRCKKVCLTAGLSNLLSRWVLPNALKFGAVDPIIDMVVDNERHILYTRTEEMKLQVYDLGANGNGPIKKVAEQRNLVDQRDGARRSVGARMNSQSAKPSIVCIAPLSSLESKWLQLVVVLSDGRRLYLSTSASGGSSSSVGSLTGLNTVHHRPSCLKVVTSRPSPPLGVGGNLPFGRSNSEDLTLKVETANYSAGLLTLSNSSPSTMSSLLIVNKDSTSQSTQTANFGLGGRNVRALRESVVSLPIEGRMLYVADISPLPDMVAAVQLLYIDAEPCEAVGDNSLNASGKLWAQGDMAIQHILPRRRVVIFSTMGMMELVFNRPVDILRRILESSAPRSVLEDFFNRFGAVEAAAMCLMLAAKMVNINDGLVSNIVAEKAAEVFEDPRIVGMPQLENSSAALTSSRTPPGGFSMGQVVQEAEPVFSGAHEGLCLCASRLLFPAWELPIMVVRGDPGSDSGVVVCRLSVEAMQVLESKLRSLELFLRSRRNQKRGLYGCVAGFGDFTGSILYKSGAADRSLAKNLFGSRSPNIDASDGAVANKRQRLPYNSTELAAMEVRGMECIRRLIRRASEALFLLQLASCHHVTRLLEDFDANMKQQLLQLTFHQLVCSEEGDFLATRLIAGLMKYYVGPDGRGTVDDISAKLREGCPSYYNESNYKFFLAVDCLEKAALLPDPHERENLARDAYNVLTKVTDSANLSTICKRFEELRYYEAVVCLPLQKAQSLDPMGDALSDQIDQRQRENAVAKREECYAIVTNALRALKDETGSAQKEFGDGVKKNATISALDKESKIKYIRQIVLLGVQWPDKAFHEHLYRTMIEIGLDNELLEYGGPDLVPFLQSAGRQPVQEARAVSLPANNSPASQGHGTSTDHTKYLELLARYYVLKRQHELAAHILLRLAERRSTGNDDGLTLDKRHQYLSNAVIQAKSSCSSGGHVSSGGSALDLLDLVESKLAVLRFQIRIREKLEAMASRLEDSSNTSNLPAVDPFPQRDLVGDANLAKEAREKARELSLDLKSITQLYNDYAVPFELWEICLEMLHFANYSGDADSSIVRETWARLLDQALSRGGVAEACSVLKRVGGLLYPGDGLSLPLDTVCLHLEKAAVERSTSGAELVGDEDVARALLGACRGAAEPVLNAYDHLLSTGALLTSLNLRLRLFRSVLLVLREWATNVLAEKMDMMSSGTSFLFGGTYRTDQTVNVNKGIRDKIASAANRYMTEVRRLSLPQSQTESVYRGFRELEEMLLSSSMH